MRAAMLVALFVAAPALAVDVAGNVGEDVPNVWTAEMSPIRVVGHVTVPEGQELVVEPGTVVHFTVPTEPFVANQRVPRKYQIRVSGSILVGTPSGGETVLFTREGDDTRSNGGGVRLLRDSVGEMYDTIIEHQWADDVTWGGGLDDEGGALSVYRADLIAERLILRHSSACLGGGLYVQLVSNNAVIIEDSLIVDNEAISCGTNAAGGGGAYLYNFASGGGLLLQDVVIANNRYQRGWTGSEDSEDDQPTSNANTGNFEGGGGVTIRGNQPVTLSHVTITGNAANKGPGVHIEQGHLWLEDSVVWGNTGGRHDEQISYQTGTNAGGSPPSSGQTRIENTVLPPDPFVVVWRNTEEEGITFDAPTSLVESATSPLRADSYELACGSVAIDHAPTDNVTPDALGRSASNDPSTGEASAIRDLGAVEFVGDSGLDSDDDSVCDPEDVCLGDDALGDRNGNGFCLGTDPDDDDDGCPDSIDLDPTTPSIDSDEDGLVDDCDPCPADNPDDSDGDGICESIDLCLGDNATGDPDDDGVCGDLDGDDDGDGCPDAADPAPQVASEDPDDDGFASDCDICPDDPADDSDGDGVCDGVDDCTGDDEAGDTDDDGLCDDIDPDIDGDGCPNGSDDAPTVPSADDDEDGRGADCDPCPDDNPDDTDGDGVCDADDVCIGADSTGDPDGNGICADLECTDTDEDGICDASDRCEGDDRTGDADGDGLCDDVDLCLGANDSGDEDEDGVCALDGDDEILDCDDDDPDVFPGAPELCDGKDNTCAGTVPDEDGDADTDGMSICEGDCDDDDPDVYLGAPELCDGLDNACTGDVPFGEVDADADGFRRCDDDCDDLDADAFPGNPEVCDGVDNDCDGNLGPGETDADGDGELACAGDCDDDNALARSDYLEVCGDGVDNDCSGGEEDECGCKGLSTLPIPPALGAPWVLALVLIRRRRRA